MDTQHDVAETLAAATGQLEELDALPTSDHVAVYEELHDAVAGVLAEIDSDHS